MDAGSERELRPPEALRPAQVGIVLVGRVIFGHVSATLVDLAQRGFLSVDETHDGLDEPDDEAGRDWLLIDRRGRPGSGSDALLGFERVLLDGLFYAGSVVRLSGVGESFVLPLSEMRKQLRRDAVRNGWLRRWGRGKRTARGEQLLHQIQGFRRELRTLAAAGDAAMAGLTPYAMIFGLARAPSITSADGVGTSDQDANAWAQGQRFARALTDAFGKIRSPLQAWVTYQQSDPVHAWSAPHGHQHGHGHGQQQGHGGSHGGHMGGGGHVGGGGHGGH